MATDVNDLRVETLAKEQYLKPAQRAELQENIARDEAYLRGHGPNGQPLAHVPGIPLPDADMVRENLARDRAMLDAGTPPKLSPLQIRQHMNWLDTAEAQIKHGMPTIDQMWRPLAPNIDIAIAHGGVNKPWILARKTVLSRLDPDNDEPNFRSVELMRTNDPPSVDLRQYWRNYELIKFKTNAVTEVRELPLDDETFGRFCQFKAADWSPKLIRRELALSETQYEQAMTRLQTMKPRMPEDDDPEAQAEVTNGGTPDHTDAKEPFHVWLKAALNARHLVHRGMAEELSLKPNYFTAMLNGRMKIPHEVRERATRAIEQFDAGTLLLRQHEEVVAP